MNYRGSIYTYENNSVTGIWFFGSQDAYNKALAYVLMNHKGRVEILFESKINES